MHVFIIAAISADGFISRYDEHSSISWRSKEDGQFFIQKTKEFLVESIDFLKESIERKVKLIQQETLLETSLEQVKPIEQGEIELTGEATQTTETTETTEQGEIEATEQSEATEKTESKKKHKAPKSK